MPVSTYRPVDDLNGSVNFHLGPSTSVASRFRLRDSVFHVLFCLSSCHVAFSFAQMVVLAPCYCYYIPWGCHCPFFAFSSLLPYPLRGLTTSSRRSSTLFMCSATPRHIGAPMMPPSIRSCPCPDFTSSVAPALSHPLPKRRRAKRTEEERIEYLRADPYVAQFQPYRVLCASCDKWIRLRPNSTYCSIPWDAHRKSCLAKKINSKNVYALDERNALLSKDPDVRKFDAERVLCNMCDAWIALNPENHLQAVQAWLQHRAACQTLRASFRSPPSVTATVTVDTSVTAAATAAAAAVAPPSSPPLPNALTPAHESRRRNAEHRAAILRGDTLIAAVEPNRVFCSLCQKWVQLRQDSSYCAYPWLQHRGKCLARSQRRARKAAEIAEAKARKLGHGGNGNGNGRGHISGSESRPPHPSYPESIRSPRPHGSYPHPQRVAVQPGAYSEPEWEAEREWRQGPELAMLARLPQSSHRAHYPLSRQHRLGRAWSAGVDGGVCPDGDGDVDENMDMDMDEDAEGDEDEDQDQDQDAEEEEEEEEQAEEGEEEVPDGRQAGQAGQAGTWRRVRPSRLADLDSVSGRRRFVLSALHHLASTTYARTDDMRVAPLLTYLAAAVPPDKHADFGTAEVVRALAALQRRGCLRLEGDVVRLEC
ncbi:hypothetical protein D9615_002151 [Tricholomella constricta]|uniref:Uncharacterized protein n=1 Tax=Tricholomella constricta TaxID=117010 RepID=A0A8H5HPF3_9AGAR|nr:hypothetical protein D9615_002151 [Tricholomella constricta]